MSETRRKKDEEGGDRQKRLRSLAAVDEVLREPAVEDLLGRYPRALVVDAVRAVLDRLRADILAAGEAGEAAAAQAAELTPAALVPWIARLLEAAVTPSLRRVINATGVVVHTNLGRALLPQAAVDAVVTAASGYSDLEYSLARGDRASRQDHVHDVLCTVTGAEDALAVNNNAAAIAARARRHGAWRRGARRPRPAGRDRRRLPHPRHPPRERRRAGRGGHHQPYVPQGLRGRLDRPDAGDPARAHEQLPHRRVHRGAGAGRAGRARARARRRARRRPRQRRPRRPGVVRARSRR